MICRRSYRSGGLAAHLNRVAVHAMLMLLMLWGARAGAAAAPNLVAQNITVSPAQTFLGLTTITVTMSIKNIGTAPAGANVTQVWASTTKVIAGAGTHYLLTSLFVPALAAGQSVDYTVAKGNAIYIDPLHVGAFQTDYITPNNYYIVASVDTFDQVPGEADENNIFASSGQTNVLPMPPQNSPYYWPISGATLVSVSRPLQWGSALFTARYDVYLARLKDCVQNFVKHQLDNKTSGARKIYVRDLHGFYPGYMYYDNEIIPSHIDPIDPMTGLAIDYNAGGAGYGAFRSPYHDLLVPQSNQLMLYFQPFRYDPYYYYNPNLPLDYTLPSNSHYMAPQSILSFTTSTRMIFPGEGSAVYQPGSISAVCTANFMAYDYVKDEGWYGPIHNGIDVAVANYMNYEAPDLTWTPPGTQYSTLGEGSVTVLMTTVSLPRIAYLTWTTEPLVLNPGTTFTRTVDIWTSHTNYRYGALQYSNIKIPLLNYAFNDKKKPIDKVHPYGIKSLVAADFDNDMDVDIIAGSDRIAFGTSGNLRNDKLVIYQNSYRNDKNDDALSMDRPAFHPKSIGFHDEIDDLQDMAVGDFDRDGREDIAFVSFFGNEVGVMENTTNVDGDDKSTRTVKFSIHRLTIPVDAFTTSTQFRGANSVLAVDLDNNRRADIVASSYLEGRIVCFENVTTGTGSIRFIPHIVASGLPAIENLSYADVNGDGLMDILAESPTNDSFYWYANNGNFTFTEHLISNQANGVSCVVGYDMNQDGFMDLLTATPFDNTINWWGDYAGLPPSSKIASDVTDIQAFPPQQMDFDCSYIWKVVGKSGALTNADTAPVNSFHTQRARTKITPTFQGTMVEPGNGLGLDVSAVVDGPDPTGFFWVYVFADANLNRPFYGGNINPWDQWPLFSLGNYYFSNAGYNPGRTFNFAVNFDTTNVPEGQYKLYVAAYGASPSGNDGLWDGVVDGVLDGYDTDPRPYGLPWDDWTYNYYGDDVYETNQLSVIYKPDVPSKPTPPDKAINVSNGTGMSWTPTKYTMGYDLLMTPASSIAASFTSSTISTTLPVPRTLAAGDFNGDGAADLVCSYVDGTGKIAWMKNSGTGSSFGKNQIISNLPEAPDIAVADMDGDGKPDVIAGLAATGQIWWQKNQGGFTPTFSTPLYVSTTADGLSSVRTADLDKDGLPDVIAAMVGPKRLCWYNNKITGFIAHTIDVDNGLPVFAIPADLNGDGLTDIVAAFWSPNSVAWYENKGGSPPTFVRHVINTTINKPQDLAAADIDGDGAVDIALISPTENKVAWFRNNGKTGSQLAFSMNVIDSSITGLQSLVVSDPNRDALSDIVTASSTNNVLYYFSNNGGSPATFTRYPIATLPSAVLAATSADFNADGFNEVAASSLGGITSWFNYKRSYQFGVPPAQANSALLTKASFQPSPKLDAGMQYQWLVDAKRMVPIFGGQTLTRTTRSALWSFTTGQSDLQAASLNMAPRTVNQAQNFTVTWTENNIGYSDSRAHFTDIWASPDMSITRTGNDIRLAHVSIPAIKAGGTMTKTITVNAGAVGLQNNQVLPEGLYYLGVFIDPGGSDPSEYNKENNKLIKTQGRLTVTRHNAAETWKRYQ